MIRLDRELNFAKLNHILIPATKPARDRLRQRWIGKLARPLLFFYEALSDEGRVLAVLTLIVGGFGQDVRSSEIYLVWCCLAALLVASLVVRPLFALDGVRLEVRAPPRVTVGEEIAFDVTLVHDGDRDRHALRVHGPFLPWDGRWTVRWPRVRRLARGERAHVELRARFVERGEHHLDPFRATALVPFGMAQGRAVASGGVRFLVVPRIARVARLALPSGRRHQPGGVALASRTGESLDLLGLRPYRPGDPVRDLHARSWARLGVPVVREYQEEYFRRIGVVIDVDAGTTRRREAALSLAAGLVAHLARGEALIDLLVLGDRAHDLTLGRSLGFLEQALDLLACVEADARARRKAALDADAILARVEPHLARLSSVVVVTTADGDGGLAARVRAHGAGCLVLKVVDGGAATNEAADERVIAADRIERGEALAL